MKVWITSCKDGYGGCEVEKVFGSREKAIEFVIANKFIHNSYYLNRTPEFLKFEALKHLEEYFVE